MREEARAGADEYGNECVQTQGSLLPGLSLLPGGSLLGRVDSAALHEMPSDLLHLLGGQLGDQRHLHA